MASAVVEKAKAEKKRLEEEIARRGANFWQISKDSHRLRIMPPYDSEGNWFRQFGKHWKLGPEGNVVVYCPQETFAQPCAVCNALKRVIGDIYEIIHKNPSREAELKRQIETIKEKRANPRYYVNLVDMDEPTKGVRVGELPQTVIFQILEVISNDAAGYGDITDPDSGFDIFLKRTRDPSDKRNVKYTITTPREPSAIDKALIPTIVNLDMIVKFETPERMLLLSEGKDTGMVTRGNVEVLPPETRSLPPPPMAAAPPPLPTFQAQPPQMAGPPPCFGQFDLNAPKCLDCVEGEDCEDQFVAARKAARAASKATTTAPSNVEVVNDIPATVAMAETVPAAQEPVSTSTVIPLQIVPAPTVVADVPPVSGMSTEDELIARMKASLKGGQKAA